MRSILLSATIVSVLVLVTATAADDANKPDGLKPLNHFVGVWNTELTYKPAKRVPNGAKRAIKESTMWILKDRFILGREVNQADGVKLLWLMTYDPKTNAYPFCLF